MMKYLPMLTNRTAIRAIIFRVGIITITTLFVVGASFYMYTTYSMVSSLQEQASRTADEIASVLSFPLYTLDDAAAVNNAKVYMTSGRLSGIRLISDASGVLFDSLGSEKSMIEPMERKITYKGMQLGEITLIMDDSGIKSAQKRTFIIILLLICGVLFVHALLLHSVIKKILSNNFDQIIRGIDRFKHNSFDEKIRNVKYDDLNQLILGLNTMAESIKKNQLEIIENEQRLSIALKGGKSGIWDWNLKTGAVFADPNYYTLAGYEPYEFSPEYKEFLKKVHPDDINTVKERVKSCLDGKTDDLVAEFRFRHKSNSWMWILSSGRISDFDGNTATRFTGIHVDISDRKSAEQELYNLQNYLSNILDSMPSIIVGVDFDGKVTQWNKTAEQVTGVPSTSAHGRILSNVFPRMASQTKKIEKSITTGEIQREQKVCLEAEEGTLYEDITIYPLVGKDVEGAVIRVDDVTEQVRLQEMMVQSEKMLSVGGLAAGMAHEINNPLAGMMQTSDVISYRLGATIDLPANLKAAEQAGITMEAVKKFMDARDIPRMLATIKESGKRVAAIVSNMLSFARKSDSLEAPHDLVKLMDKTLELARTDYNLQKNFDFKAIRITKEYEDSLPELMCEGAKIQQVLLNLLRNGAQAMQENFQDDKDHEFILRLRLERQKNMFCIEIEDNGPGIDKENCKRIFEPFFTTKLVGVGTGLGLSVSYFIITENHGGTMHVTSEPGSGAKFTICLPLKKENHKLL